MITTFNKIIDKLQVLENGHLLSNKELELLKENFELIWTTAQPSVKQIENKLRGNVRPKPKISKRWETLHNPEKLYDAQVEALEQLYERLQFDKNVNTFTYLRIINLCLKQTKL